MNDEFYKFPSNKDYDYCASCRVGNNILVVLATPGGVESNFFNTISKQWSYENVKTKRHSFEAVHYLDKVWIVGGWNYVDGGNKNTRQMFNTIQIYDPVNKTTFLSPVKMIQARHNHKVIVYKNKLFLFGGCISYDDEALNSVEMYSPETNRFTMMAPMKIARSEFACCRAGNLVYVIGGRVKGGWTSSVEIYNIDTNTWTDGMNSPIGSPGLFACAVDNKL